MVFSTARSVLVIFALSTLSVSAGPSLSLRISGPDSVNDVANLKVVATVVNTGNETLNLLNDPSSPLSIMPTNTFTITDSSGATPDFTGIKVKYVPTFAASSTEKGIFTVLSPGQSIDVTHDLSAAYDFTRTGEGIYNFEARNLFQYVDDQKNVISIYADTASHSTSIHGRLAVVKPSLIKRAQFIGCNAAQQSDLNAAASAAQNYARQAFTYTQVHLSATPRYTTWFGAYTAPRHSTIHNHFELISSNAFSSYRFDCTCTDPGTYAFVNPNNFGYVTLCGAFWRAPPTGTDSKAGTLVHEASHFTRNGGTRDHIYGQAGCRQLALNNPDQATNNADSHEYYAENTPALA